MGSSARTSATTGDPPGTVPATGGTSGTGTGGAGGMGARATVERPALRARLGRRRRAVPAGLPARGARAAVARPVVRARPVRRQRAAPAGWAARGTGAGTGGAGGTGMVSAACVMCEKQMCSDWETFNLYGDCHEDTAAVAAGPAMGRPRNEVCGAAVACMRRTGCLAQGGAEGCYCGAASQATCLGGQPAGPCRQEFEAAAGTSDPQKVSLILTDPKHLVGTAVNLIMACDQMVCLDACSGSAGAGGMGGTGGASGTGGTTATGGVGGATATGGVGGATATGGVGGTTATGGTGGTTATGGTGGSAMDAPVDAPAGGCPDLDGNNVADCQESLVMNPDLRTRSRPAGRPTASAPRAGPAIATPRTTPPRARWRSPTPPWPPPTEISLGGAQQCVAGHRGQLPVDCRGVHRRRSERRPRRHRTFSSSTARIARGPSARRSPRRRSVKPARGDGSTAVSAPPPARARRASSWRS